MEGIMKKLKVIAIIIVLIVVVGAGVFFAVVPGMVEKSMNKVVEHSSGNENGLTVVALLLMV